MPQKQRWRGVIATTQASSTSAPPTSAPSTQTPKTDTETLPKPSRAAWKNGNQLEYLFSQFESYLCHQDKGKLARFWPPIYDTWYKKWPSPEPTPQAIGTHGSVANATLVFRSRNNRVCLTNSYLQVVNRSHRSREFVRGFTTRPAQVPKLSSRT